MIKKDSKKPKKNKIRLLNCAKKKNGQQGGTNDKRKRDLLLIEGKPTVIEELDEEEIIK